MGDDARLGMRPPGDTEAASGGPAPPRPVPEAAEGASFVRALFASRLVFDPELSVEELRGFSRTVREIEWLLLVLVLLYHTVLTPDDESASAIAMALFFSAPSSSRSTTSISTGANGPGSWRSRPG